MKRSLKVRWAVALTVILLIAASVCAVLVTSSHAEDGNVFGGTLKQTFDKTEALERLMDCSHHYVVVKHKQLGGTHYAYTAALAETTSSADIYKEYNFDAGSEMVLLSVLDNNDGTVSTYEKTILRSTNGVLRDPSVSMDGTKVCFSMKKDTYDDFHIYEIALTDSSYTPTQLTFGNGRSDIEPQYLPNGDIIFSSNRSVQVVDCWITPVSHMYVMSGDGTHIRRLGYDQVHTTFPTVASDGRVLYTRWDYNDRTQMFVQGVFQMFADGTYQTELWGNNATFPTTLLHTREIPGSTGKYISIASGHHVNQQGKLCVVDTTVDRNDSSAITFLFPDSDTSYRGYVDGYGQSGRVYKYPYAIDASTVLVSTAASQTGKNTPYSIYLCDTTQSFSSAIELVKGTNSLPASQIVPIRTTDVFDRVSTVNYADNSGVYYVANVYEGAAVKGVARGSVKQLRVVEIVYRSSAIGATFANGGYRGGTGDPFSPVSTGTGSWDVKAVLGVVPVEDDGSALFRVPADTPVFFQLLDENGCVIQTMRSWSTLMPGEAFSCVGCHESKNTAPVTGSVTMAMKKGVQDLQPEPWMADHPAYSGFDPYKDDSVGFSYPDMVQSIFDESCVSCHSNTAISLKAIKAETATADASVDALQYIIPFASEWNCTVGGANGKGYAPFGAPGAQTDINTKWTSGTETLTKTFRVSQYQLDACDIQLRLKYSGSVGVTVNGTSLYSGSSNEVKNEVLSLDAAQKAVLHAGNDNSITVTVSGGTYYIDCALKAAVPDNNLTMIEKASNWKYLMSSSADAAGSGWYLPDFNDASWSTGQAPFGDRNDVSKANTAWSGSQTCIWIRREFDLTSEQLEAMQDQTVTLNIFYDDNMHMYINGTEVLTKGGWNDAYELIDLPQRPQDIFTVGRNVIAISLQNTGGGREIDLSMKCSIVVEAATSSAPFSLEGSLINPSSNRMQRIFPLSYLVLTSSTPVSRGNQTGGIDWEGRSSGKYVNWISTMTEAEMLEPASAGSTQSLLYTKVKEGHGNLSDAQKRAIACWIDLAGPCFGAYNENEAFLEEAMRMFVERENKRNFYDQWDKCVKMELGGVLPEGSLDVTYTVNGNKATYTKSGDGYVLLDVPAKMTVGDTLTVRVTGSDYIAVTFNERQGESLLYVPNGTFTFKVPTDAATVYNVTMRAAGTGYYRSFTILVRIPTQEELAKTRNLAYNPYDLGANNNTFPHAQASSFKSNAGKYSPRAAIDGFISNRSDAAWPYQAWCPDGSDDETAYTVNFGRNVKVDSMQILLRNAAADTHLLSMLVTFSNGESETVYLHKADRFFTFDLGGRTVTSLTLSDFETAGSGNFAITELRVFGTDA